MKKQTQLDEISGKDLNERVFHRLLPYLRPHKYSVAFAIALVFVSAGVAMYTPKLLGRMVDRALIPKRMDLLYQLLAIYVGLEILRLLSIYWQSIQLQKIGQKVMQALRKDLFGRLLRMPVPFFDKNPVGKLVTRVTNDTVNLSELFSAGFVMLLSDLLLIVGVIGAMLAMHWKLGLIAVSVFPFMIFCMVYFSGRLRIAFRSSRDVLARLNGFYAEKMAGMPVVQLMEREKFEQKAYEDISLEYRERQFESVYLYSLFHPAITVLSAASIALVLWFAPTFLELKEINLGTYVAFLAYVQVLYQPVRNITDRYNIFLAAMASAERIFTLMDMDEEEGVNEKSNSKRSESLGGLTFESVTFSYPSAREGEARAALRNINFSIGANETVAIIGHTGAGKSTITSLLFRFYAPTSGRILLGGRDLSEIPKRELRERIGFVQQDVFLFSGTLRENLVLLRRGIEDAEILQACQRTGFSRVLARMEAGLNTLLDERGSNLSHGERQILAFTRVYLQQPDILVLDEATSSVDRESEELLQNAAKELMKGRASVVIAHRLETVKHADKILVLERGELVEVGNHESLLASGGRYSRFVQLQEQH